MILLLVGKTPQYAYSGEGENRCLLRITTRVYIGKGYMTSEKLQALADIVRSGAASNISDAIAVYKSQEETAK